MMTTNVFSQEITVRFTGQLNGNDYCQLDSVVITNLTRDWSETVEYPDTIIVLGSTVGSNINIVAEQGLGQNIPNPFDCKTRVELSVSLREDVKMQLLDVAGRVYAEYNSSVDAGMHIFEISADNSQTYLLNAIIGKHQYSIRMVNVGSGCGYSIKYAGKSNGIKAKLASTNEFRTGDNMRYVGYATIEGELVESSAVEQSQVVNQYITLDFTYYFIPSIETLDATEITATTATLNAIITDDGGADVTARGFYYGLSPENLAYQAVSDVTTNSFSAIVTPLDANTTYYYKAYATNSAGTAIGDVVSFTTENDHDYVDLGLPSGTLWATCNLGATNPEDNGNYYAWGETSTKETYGWDNYSYCNGSATTITKYCNNPDYGNEGFIDTLTTLETIDDAATTIWGTNWRMPTYDDFNELYIYCSITRVEQNGVNGRLVTGPNGNSIFMPDAGYYDSSLNTVGSSAGYWSSSLVSNQPNNAWYFFFNLDNYGISSNYGRFCGRSIRPVRNQ